MQLTSKKLAACCAGKNVPESMGATGVRGDMAVTASAISNIKDRFYDHSCVSNRQAANQDTMHFNQVFHNRWRPHTYNQGLPPTTAMANFTGQGQPRPVASQPAKN